MKTNVKTNPTQRGQGMMEYIIIVAMIAVAAIGTYSMFGKTIRNQTAGMAREIAGKDGTTEIGQADTSSTTSSSRGNAKKGMAEYNVDNDQN